LAGHHSFTKQIVDIMGREEKAKPSASLMDWFGTGFMCSSLLVALPTLIAYRFTGRAGMEKALTAMTNPLFLAWFGIITAALVARGRGERGVFRGLMLLAVLVWGTSAPYVVQQVIAKWEQKYVCIPFDEIEPYDVVVVLGGGSSTRPSRDPQFGSAGDRMGFAARLYHQGKAKKLVTTGSVLELNGSLIGELKQGEGPSEQTLRIWRDLEIPEADIILVEGQNTSTEMSELASRENLWRGKRCGLVTSAYHLPRAMKLAENAGLRFEPIPVDFWSRPEGGPVTVELFFPSPSSVDQLGRLIKEWLAMGIGR
jgi:uncharacterized SAM-binding protein YcdF (DUF218 family)